jgi:hypothetical protein
MTGPGLVFVEGDADSPVVERKALIRLGWK